jgi:Ran GTPase-activating protein (RanGAP) involved in mRNA processing and transport
MYLRSCAEMGLRPNSAVLGLLPDKGGVDFGGATLDLSRNYVGDRGVAPILSTLQRMPSVRAIILSENGLRNHGIELLCASASRLPQLEFIDVSDNFISEGAAVALEKLLVENHHIKDIAFENTKIPVEWRVKILNALEANRSEPTLSAS